jgi:hypothetical protein
VTIIIRHNSFVRLKKSRNTFYDILYIAIKLWSDLQEVFWEEFNALMTIREKFQCLAAKQALHSVISLTG